jgi:hypothetical protein
MTPGQYIALARDIAVVVGLAIIGWLVYRGGEDRVKASNLRDLQAEIQQQAKTLEKWRGESTDAQKQLSADVAAITTAPVVVHDWVRQPSCPQPAMLPAAAAQAGSHPSADGGFQSGARAAPDGDRRDSAVAAFKQHWETVLAQCRALDAQWPQ